MCSINIQGGRCIGSNPACKSTNPLDRQGLLAFELARPVPSPQEEILFWCLEDFEGEIVRLLCLC